MISNSKVVFTLSLLMICFCAGLRIKRRIDAVNYQFNGKIDSVFYDNKNSPTILVNGKQYPLSDNDWLFDTRFKKGDLVFKKSKSPIIKLTKFNTGEIFLIKEADPFF